MHDRITYICVHIVSLVYTLCGTQPYSYITHIATSRLLKNNGQRQRFHQQQKGFQLVYYKGAYGCTFYLAWLTFHFLLQVQGPLHAEYYAVYHGCVIYFMSPRTGSSKKNIFKSTCTFSSNFELFPDSIDGGSIR